MIALLLLTADDQIAALKFNNQDQLDYWRAQDASFPQLTANNPSLMDGVAVLPRAIDAPAPYAYAGKYILPTALITNPDFAIMWNFLAGFSTVLIDPAEAWPNPGGDI